MKQILTLKGDYAGKKVRRLKKFGRIELLRCFHDPEEILQTDYWFVRITGFSEERDRPRLRRCGSNFGNGYFRFGHFADAEAKFKELASQPESMAEAKEAEFLRDKKRERALAMVGQGKLKLFEQDPA